MIGIIRLAIISGIYYCSNIQFGAQLLRLYYIRKYYISTPIACYIWNIRLTSPRYFKILIVHFMTFCLFVIVYDSRTRTVRSLCPV